jgi:hypothetical protein
LPFPLQSRGLPPKGEWLEYCFEGTHSGLCNKLGE